MKLLLCENISHLGIVGDIVEVAEGYGRNYLVPQGLATQPTQGNVRKLAQARRNAELERIRNHELLETFAQRLEGVEVTVRARANEEGVLYGSVGPREVAAALAEEGYPVEPEHVVMDAPIRHLDNVTVEIKLGEGLKSAVKIWVVREKLDQEEEDTNTIDAGSDGREAPSHVDDRAGE